MPPTLSRAWLLVGVCCFLTVAICSAKDQKVTENKPSRTDRYGDPLPEGAIARLGTVRLRHNSPVYSLSFSPDGRTIASGCHDGQVHLWDVGTGKETGRMGVGTSVARRHPGPGRFVSFSADGKTIATAGWPKEGVELWNVATGARSVLGGDVQSLFMAFSPDGKLLGEKTDGFLRLWDLSTGRIILQLEDHQGAISPPAYALAFSPDSKTVAFGGTDPVIRLWEVSTGKPLRQFKGHQDSVSAVTFSPDGKNLVSAGWDSTVRVWDVNKGMEIRQFKGHHGRVYSAVIAPDGKTVCSACEDDTVRLWERATGRELKRFSVQGMNVLPVAFSPDGKLVAVGAADHILHLWNLSTGKDESPGTDDFLSFGWVAFLAGNKSLISKSWRDDKFRFWDPLTGKEKKEESQLGKSQDWTLSLDGKTLAALGFFPPNRRELSIQIGPASGCRHFLAQ